MSAAVDIIDAGLGLVNCRHGVVLTRDPRVAAFGKRVDGHGLKVACLNQIVERLRSLLFIYCVGIDSGAHGVEVFLQQPLSHCGCCSCTTEWQ